MLVILVSMVIGSAMGKSADSRLNRLNNQLRLLVNDPEHRVNFWPILYWAWAGAGRAKLIPGRGSRLLHSFSGAFSSYFRFATLG
jgi:hypothetical protein